jgi:histidyl-tRNA synthetase
VTADTGAEMRSRGMRDLPPDEMERVRLVEDGFRRVCRSWGYREIRTPAIEPLHLFTAAGTLSPKMLDSVYSFLDWDGWSGERVVLRPDSTIPAARLYAETMAGGGTAKLFYCQSIYRFATDASSREEWQCGVELIGDSGLAGDVELVLLALETLRALELPPLTVRVSHARLVRAVVAAAGLSPEEQSAAYDRLLDGDVGVVDEIEARLPQIDAPLRLLFEVEGSGSGYVENLRAVLPQAIPALAPVLAELGFVVAALEARGVPLVVQSALARSFEYYSGLVFKIYAGEERICSGGRYDNLVALIGGAPARASGFAHYVGPIVARMAVSTGESARRITVMAAEQTPELVADTHVVAAQLRALGFVAATGAGLDGDLGTSVICDASNSLRLVDDGRSTTYATVEDLLHALEQAAEAGR